jgi:MFS family permease
MIAAFLIGVFVGILCVGGLALGLKWLFKSRDESIEEGQRMRLGLMGVAVIVGQFILAGVILFYTPNLDQHPMALASGLLSMNLLLPLAIGVIMKSKNKKDAP